MKSKKAVLLDLGGVVFDGTGRSSASVDWSVISRLNNQYGHDLNVGKDRFPEFLLAYNQQTDQQLSPADFLSAVFDTLCFNAELVNFLRSRYPIYVVSDNYRENIEYIRQRYRFSDWATREFYSFDFQMEKADPSFFPALLERIEEEPQELFLIDDSPHKLASAATCGISGLLFENTSEIIQRLP